MLDPDTITQQLTLLVAHRRTLAHLIQQAVQYGGEVGDNQSVHDGQLRGPGGAVALNVTFLADAIDAILTPSVAFHFTSAHQPIVLRGVGDGSYTHVACP